MEAHDYPPRNDKMPLDFPNLGVHPLLSLILAANLMAGATPANSQVLPDAPVVVKRLEEPAAGKGTAKDFTRLYDPALDG